MDLSLHLSIRGPSCWPRNFGNRGCQKPNNDEQDHNNRLHHNTHEAVDQDRQGVAAPGAEDVWLVGEDTEERIGHANRHEWQGCCNRVQQSVFAILDVGKIEEGMTRDDNIGHKNGQEENHGSLDLVHARGEIRRRGRVSDDIGGANNAENKTRQTWQCKQSKYSERDAAGPRPILDPLEETKSRIDDGRQPKAVHDLVGDQCASRPSMNGDDCANCSDNAEQANHDQKSPTQSLSGAMFVNDQDGSQEGGKEEDKLNNREDLQCEHGETIGGCIDLRDDKDKVLCGLGRIAVQSSCALFTVEELRVDYSQED